MNELKIKDLKTMDFMGLFSPDGEQIKLRTKDMAKQFGKRHNDLLTIIDRRLDTIKSMEGKQYESFVLHF